MHEPLTLSNIGEGAAEELFQEELSKIIKNIADINTSGKKVRELLIKIKILPNEGRDFGVVAVEVTSKLAPLKPFGTQIFIGKDKGILVAREHNPKQLELFDRQETVVNLCKEDE